MKGIKNHKIKISSTFSERCQEIKKRGIIPSFLGLPKLDSNHVPGNKHSFCPAPRKTIIDCFFIASPPLLVRFALSSQARWFEEDNAGEGKQKGYRIGLEPRPGRFRLRPLTVATVTTLRKDLLPDFRRERRLMQQCNSHSYRLVAPAYGRHRYHPAKGSFARFPSGVSLNATMQFTLLPSELGQNLSFSGVDYALTSE